MTDNPIVHIENMSYYYGSGEDRRAILKGFISERLSR
jgi:hypothetical protein